MQRPQVLLAGPFLCLAFLSVAVDTASAAEDSIAVTARFYATPGREAEVEVRLLQVLAFVRKAEPNITYRLQRSQKDPTNSVYLTPGRCVSKAATVHGVR